MTHLWPSSDTQHHLLLSLLLDDFLSFISFLTSHPLHSAYLLFFSPYLLQVLSFLSPLLLSTTLLLLSLLTVSPVLSSPPPSSSSPDSSFLGSTACRLLLDTLKSKFEAEATIELVEQLGWMVLAPTGNAFDWEFDTIGEFYKHSGLNCEMEYDPVEIFLENCKEREVSESHCGIGVKGMTFDPQLAHKVAGGFEPASNTPEWEFKTMDEFCKHSDLNCEVQGDPVRLSFGNCKESELSEFHSEIGDQSMIFDDGQLALKVEENNVSEWESETTGEFYDSASLNFEIKEDTVELAIDSSKESELLEPHSGIGAQCAILDAQLTDKDAEDSLDIDSFKPKTPSRTPENLTSSCSRRRKEHSRGASESLHKGPSESLQRDGSMRKEKEWKRTLACKLYEERMTFKLCEERTVVDGGEEMDLLWEAYEVDANKAEKLKKDKGNNGKIEAHKEEEEEEEEEEDDEGMARQFCCLQALKLSTGKMNLGVGRPNLMKISKAFKGFGLFHRSGRRSRKG